MLYPTGIAPWQSTEQFLQGGPYPQQTETSPCNLVQVLTCTGKGFVCSSILQDNGAAHITEVAVVPCHCVMRQLMCTHQVPESNPCLAFTTEALAADRHCCIEPQLLPLTLVEGDGGAARVVVHKDVVGAKA